MRQDRLPKLLILAFGSVLIVLPISSFAREPVSPRLILQITVDALRGDLPTRYYNRLGKGGCAICWMPGRFTATPITATPIRKQSLDIRRSRPAPILPYME